MTKSINRFSTIADWTYEPVLAASPVFAQVTRMSNGEERAINILRELHAAEEELVGRAVVMTDGKAGTIEHVYLDDGTSFASRSEDKSADGRFRR